MFKSLFFIVGFSSAIIWSCKDDFTDKDLLESQAEIAQKAQAHEDSMSLRRIQYTVTVFDGTVSAANSGGRTEGTTGVEGASVSVTVDGAVETQTADANGMAVFENVPAGSVTGTVSMDGFTTVHFTADLTLPYNVEDPVTSAGTMVPVFETSGDNMATINGDVTYEGNLLNNTEEDVPDGVAVSFNINALDQDFVNHFLDRSGLASAPGQILSIAFEGDFTTTTSGGSYSIQLPASASGLPYDVSFGDFTADQSIAINNYENEPDGSVRDVVTVPTLFTQSRTILAGKYTQIPTINSVQVDIDAPPASGSGAAMTASLVASSYDAGLGFQIIANGSGYAVNSITIPVTISGGDYDDTVTGATPADISAVTDAAGRVVGLLVNNAGFGYRSRPTLTIGGNGSGAVIISNYVSTVAPLFGVFGDATGTTSGTVLTSGGNGYVLPPQVQFKGKTAFDTEVVVEVGTEILNGSVVDVTTPVTGFISAPTVEFKNIKRTQAYASVNGILSGEITSVVIDDFGAGYDPLSAPAVTVRDLRGNGANAIVTLQVNATGVLNGTVLMTSNGSGYSELINANYPETPYGFYIKTGLNNNGETNPENYVYVKNGITRTINAHYGTGTRERAVF